MLYFGVIAGARSGVAAVAKMPEIARLHA